VFAFFFFDDNSRCYDFFIIVVQLDAEDLFAAALKEGVDSFIRRFGTMSKKVEELAARLVQASATSSTSASASAFAS
jgi:hypothetical protein